MVSAKNDVMAEENVASALATGVTESRWGTKVPWYSPCRWGLHKFRMDDSPFWDFGRREGTSRFRFRCKRCGFTVYAPE